MTLSEAHEKSRPGDRLKHTETQLVLIRKEMFLDTIAGLNFLWMARVGGAGWTVLPRGRGV